MRDWASPLMGFPKPEKETGKVQIGIRGSGKQFTKTDQESSIPERELADPRREMVDP